MSDNKTICTLRLCDSDRFSHTRSSKTCVIDGHDTDVIICSLGQTSHSVRQLFAPVLCAARPVLLSNQNLRPENKVQVKDVTKKRHQFMELRPVPSCTFSTWYPEMSPPPLYRGGFQATMTKSFPVSTTHGVGGPAGTA